MPLINSGEVFSSGPYLLVNVPPTTPVVSYVNYENGPAHLIQVNLQRVFPKRVLYLFAFLAFAGMYVVIGWLWKLALISWQHL